MNLGDVNLNLLYIFKILMEEQHVTRAAERLEMSQPGMSNALSRLRELLDDPILVRSGGRMKPTPRALDLARPIDEALDVISDALLNSTFEPKETTRTFVIGTTAYSHGFVHRTIAAAARHAQGARFKVERIDQDDEAPEFGLFDLIFGQGKSLTDRASSRLLMSDPLVCVVDCDGPLASGFDAETFLATGHLEFPSYCHPDLVAQPFEQASRTRRVQLRTESLIGIEQLVVAIGGIAVLPSQTAAHLDAIVTTVDPPVDLPPVETRVFWEPRLTENAGNRWLRELAIASANELD